MFEVEGENIGSVGGCGPAAPADGVSESKFYSWSRFGIPIANGRRYEIIIATMGKLVVSLMGIFFLGLIYSEPAHAYLDPGAMSLWIQSIVAGIAAIFATKWLWWEKLKTLLGQSKTSEERESPPEK